ncbi:MAG: hypothetical protein IJW12_02685 [Opitutales bacterium]|nr:hypothetical protein [Opitutales bacterium]
MKVAILSLFLLLLAGFSLFAEERSPRGIGNGTANQPPPITCVLQSFPSRAEIEGASPGGRYSLVVGRKLDVEELVEFRVKNRNRESDAGWYFDAEGKVRGEALRVAIDSDLRQAKIQSLAEIRSGVSETARFIAETLTDYLGEAEITKLDDIRQAAIREETEIRNSNSCSEAQKEAAFRKLIRAQIEYSRQKSLSHHFVSRGEEFSKFVDLLLLAYPDDLNSALKIYETSQIRQKTSWGTMSELYLRKHTRGKIVPQKTLDFYKRIRLAEVLSQPNECPSPRPAVPVEISAQSVALWELVSVAWGMRESRSRPELVRDAETIKDKIREALSEYVGLREEICCRKDVMTRATELFNLTKSGKDSEEYRVAQKQFELAKHNSKRQEALGKSIADQFRTYIRFTDLLLLAYYPENLDEALALYEESLIPQKTILGKMSDVYKSAHMHENSCSTDKIRVYNAIREAEARRECEGVATE